MLNNGAVSPATDMDRESYSLNTASKTVCKASSIQITDHSTILTSKNNSGKLSVIGDLTTKLPIINTVYIVQSASGNVCHDSK